MKDIFHAGEKFHGYTIESVIGRGGLGAVYFARHEMMDMVFAIKILDPEVAATRPEYVRRFVREAKIASRIRHPNLVAVHDVGYDSAKGVYFIVMDYVNGSDLRTAIALGGAMPPEEAVRIVAAVASALAAGEPFGVVHRDIKPENIMVRHDGVVKLVDLGVAKARDTDSLQTMPHTIFGTPNYISPEQARDSSKVDFAADIYSLGIVLFEMLSGHRPYEAKMPREVMEFLLSDAPVTDIREIKSDVPPKLATLVALMCAKDPAKRIASASVLLDTLKRFGYSKEIDSATCGFPPTAAGAAGSRFNTIDYSRLASVKANNTLTFETQDTAIKTFVNAVKARKHRRNLLLSVLLGAAVGLAVALLTLALLR